MISISMNSKSTLYVNHPSLQERLQVESRSIRRHQLQKFVHVDLETVKVAVPIPVEIRLDQIPAVLPHLAVRRAGPVTGEGGDGPIAVADRFHAKILFHRRGHCLHVFGFGAIQHPGAQKGGFKGSGPLRGKEVLLPGKKAMFFQGHCHGIEQVEAQEGFIVLEAFGAQTALTLLRTFVSYVVHNLAADDEDSGDCADKEGNIG